MPAWKRVRLSGAKDDEGDGDGRGVQEGGGRDWGGVEVVGAEVTRDDGELLWGAAHRGACSALTWLALVAPEGSRDQRLAVFTSLGVEDGVSALSPSSGASIVFAVPFCE